MKENIISENLILLDIDTNSFDEVVRAAGNRFIENNYVKESYIQAVIDREKHSPTGLRTEKHAFAMPHTDPQHVLQSGVCFVRTNQPVVVSMMGDLEQKFTVKMFFVLAISDPEEYMHFLSKLMGLFQNEELLELLESTTDDKVVLDIISQLHDK